MVVEEYFFRTELGENSNRMRSRNKEEKRESRRGNNVNLTGENLADDLEDGQENNERRDTVRIIFELLFFGALGFWRLAFFGGFFVTNRKREKSWVEISGDLFARVGVQQVSVSGEWEKRAMGVDLALGFSSICG